MFFSQLHPKDDKKKSRFFVTFCFFDLLVLSSDTSESELLSTDSSSELESLISSNCLTLP